MVMKKILETKALEILSKVAKKTAEKEANSACFAFAYQPKMPDALKKNKQ